jgi:hypothetical protein
MSWSQWGGKSRFCLGFKFPTSWVLWIRPHFITTLGFWEYMCRDW